MALRFAEMYVNGAKLGLQIHAAKTPAAQARVRNAGREHAAKERGRVLPGDLLKRSNDFLSGPEVISGPSDAPDPQKRAKVAQAMASVPVKPTAREAREAARAKKEAGMRKVEAVAPKNQPLLSPVIRTAGTVMSSLLRDNLPRVHAEYSLARSSIGTSAIDSFKYWSKRMHELLESILRREYWPAKWISEAALEECREAIAIRGSPGGRKDARPRIARGHGVHPERIGRAPALRRLLQQGPIEDSESVGIFLTHHDFTCMITVQENKDDAQLRHDQTRELPPGLFANTGQGFQFDKAEVAWVNGQA